MDHRRARRDDVDGRGRLHRSHDDVDDRRERNSDRSRRHHDSSDSRSDRRDRDERRHDRHHHDRSHSHEREQRGHSHRHSHRHAEDERERRPAAAPAVADDGRPERYMQLDQPRSSRRYRHSAFTLMIIIN